MTWWVMAWTRAESFNIYVYSLSRPLVQGPNKSWSIQCSLTVSVLVRVLARGNLLQLGDLGLFLFFSFWLYFYQYMFAVYVYIPLGYWYMSVIHLNSIFIPSLPLHFLVPFFFAKILFLEDIIKVGGGIPRDGMHCSRMVTARLFLLGLEEEGKVE